MSALDLEPRAIDHRYRSVTYNATLGQCLDVAKDEDISSIDRVLAGAGIVRGLIDYKIEAPDQLVPSNIHEIIQATSDNLLGDAASFDSLEECLDDCRSFAVTGEFDWSSYVATTQADYQEASAKVHNFAPETPKLVVGVAHGGLIAARLVLAGLQTFHGESESVMYPIRYSSDKRGDTKPHISRAEVEHLQSLSQDRAIVIVDDDCYSQTTIRGMVQAFTHPRFSPYNDVEWMVLLTGTEDQLVTSVETRQRTETIDYNGTD